MGNKLDKGSHRKIHRCPEKLVKHLELLQESLTPSPSYIKQLKDLADDIRGKLAADPTLNVDRLVVAGSTGKDTGITYLRFNDETGRHETRNPDLDMVVFLSNYGNPPFKKDLKNLMSFVRTNIPNVKGLRKTPFSLQFTVQTPTFGEINCDLLPAPDQAQGSPYRAIWDFRERHRRMDFMLINKFFSSAFSESSLKFMEKVLDPFTLKVVRLAKYWNAQIILKIDGPDPKKLYVAARSAIMEQVVIQALKDKPTECVVCGFTQFLEAMAKFDELTVDVAENSSISRGCIYKFNCEERGQAPLRPIIIDPSNIQNNMAHGMDRKAVEIFKEQAKKTLALLRKFMSSNYCEECEDINEELFPVNEMNVNDYAVYYCDFRDRLVVEKREPTDEESEEDSTTSEEEETCFYLSCEDNFTED